MLDEGAQQRLIAGDVAGNPSGPHEEFLKFGGSEIGQRVHLGMAPDQFDGIQFRGIGRQQMGVHAAALREPGTDRTPVVGPQPIPDQFDRPAHGARKLLQEGEDRFAVVVGVGQKTEMRAHPSPPGRDRERRDHRDLAARAAPLPEHRGLSARRPAAPHQRTHQETGFVEEDERRPPACGVFFTRGQSSLIQRAMAASSRSMARRVGFCGLHPRPWSRRPI